MAQLKRKRGQPPPGLVKGRVSPAKAARLDNLQALGPTILSGEAGTQPEEEELETILSCLKQKLKEENRGTSPDDAAERRRRSDGADGSEPEELLPENILEGLQLRKPAPVYEPRRDAQHYLRRLTSLENVRNSWEAHWQRLSDNFLPRRSRFLVRGDLTNDGGELNRKIYDSTGTKAVRTLASGMQSGLTSPAMQWFRLGLQDDLLAQHEGCKEWLHKSQMLMLNVFARSNFYDQIHLLYNELATFGTGCMMLEEDPHTTVRCRTLTAGEYCIDTDATGRVDTLYRRLRMTARQIMQSWPDTAPQYVRQMAEEDNHAWLEVLHAVEPNPAGPYGNAAAPHEIDGERNPPDAYDEERAYSSVYMLLGGEETILERGGYFEFPALCPRWDTTGSDIYGRSPAMDALPDMSMLQRMRRDGLKALALEVNPPLNIAAAAQGAVPNVTPGAINYISPLAQGQPAITPLYQVKANLPALQTWVESYQRQVREALFSDLFTMLSDTTKQMTAAEVAERNAEKMMQLGPTLDRLRSELFQPLIHRVHNVLERRKELPKPPPELQSQPLKLEFVSILAQAQQAKGVASIERVVQFATGLAAAYPTALDKINSDEAIEQIAEMHGTPPGLINSDEQVEEIRAGRAQQQAQAQQMGAMQQTLGMAGAAAKAAKDVGVSAADLEGMDAESANQAMSQMQSLAQGAE